jgi:hypothetical protein
LELEQRLEKLELIVNSHITTSNSRLDNHNERVAVLEEHAVGWDKVVETQERMIQVGEDIIKALSWIGKVSKWTLSVAAFCTAVWHGIKFIAAKIWWWQT